MRRNPAKVTNEEEIALTAFERALLAVAEEETAIDRLDRLPQLDRLD